MKRMILRRQQPGEPESTAQPRSFDDFDLRLGDIMRGERATMGKSLLDVQRELKIRASYIAAIENADAAAFETPGFISGYVRSYARYLGLDPDWAYRSFCAEADFTPPQGLAARPRPARGGAGGPHRTGGGDPLADRNSIFAPRGPRLEWNVEPGAIGSVLVLMVLIAVLGFGGWKVLSEVQKVTLAPVEQSPEVLADLDPVGGAAGMTPPASDDLASARRDDPAPLDLPELVARDGPIASIRPGELGVFAESGQAGGTTSTAAAAGQQGDGASGTPLALAVASASRAVAEGAREARAGPAPQQVRVTEATPPEVILVATRPAWVRVRGADGAVLLERILEAGDQYRLPRDEMPARLRTGFAGAVFFVVDGTAYGPAGKGPQVVSDIPLAPDALRGRYEMADLDANPEVRRMVAQLGGADE